MKTVRWHRAMHLVLAILILIGLVAGLGFQGCKVSPNTVKTTTFQEAREIYDALLEATSLGRGLLCNDNLTGRIVWNEAQFMESLLGMYELTQDRHYLELFITHADHVLQVGDDRARRLDYVGRLRLGWQTGVYYTLGVPVTIPDDQGKPALEVQGIHRADNNYTVFEIIRKDSEHFTLLVRNDFRRSEPSEVRFKNLAMETAEAVVNKDLNLNSWIRIKVLGDSPPKQGVYYLTETYMMVLHELHTPIIAIPFLQFAELVFRIPELAVYEPKAKEYVQAFEQSFQDYADSWREDAKGGYFVYEPGRKFWVSWLTIPYNGLSANGRFLLWLWRVTGNAAYLEKAAALAKKFRAGITFLHDGTMTMPYWLEDSLPFTGWEVMSADLVNGLYTRCEPDPAAEDVSHFSLTLRKIKEIRPLNYMPYDRQEVKKLLTERYGWMDYGLKHYESVLTRFFQGYYLPTKFGIDKRKAHLSTMILSG